MTATPIQQRYHISYVSGRILRSDLVGGPRLEPGASRSRTVLFACPTGSSRTRNAPPEYKSRRVRVRWLPLMTARCRECVTRL
jgi:hypothetical protein